MKTKMKQSKFDYLALYFATETIIEYFLDCF